jgi:hypothetical protein
VTPRAKGPWASDQLESAQVKLGVQLLRKMGWSCYHLSDRRKSNLTPGVPDLVAFHSVHGMVFWEAKGMTGHVQTPPQRAFQGHCEQVGVPYVVGSFTALYDWLTLPRSEAA